MELRKTKRTIEYGNLFFCMAITLPSLVYLFTKTVRLVIHRTASLDSLLVYLLFAFVFVKALPGLRYAITKRDLALLFLGGIVLVLSALNPLSDQGLAMSTARDIVMRCIPVYLGVKMVYDSPRLSQYLRLSAIILLLRVLASVYIFPSRDVTESYSQHDGYLLLAAMAMLFVPLMDERRVYDFILAAVILLATMLTGARGPFLAAVLLVFAGLLLGGENRRGTVLRMILPTGAALLIYRYMRQILTSITKVFGNAASMRTVQRLLDNSFLEYSSRARVYSAALSYIGEHPLWGNGVLNDRVVVHEMLPHLGALPGCYPHNFFLELAMQFGVPLGFLVAVVLLTAVTHALRSCCSQRERLFLTALLFAGFVPLMVSGSYLTFTMFYALIGFCNRRSGTFEPEEDGILAEVETIGA